MKDSYLYIRIQKELKEAAQVVAAKDGRTLSNWIIKLIDKEIKNNSQTH